MSAIREVIRDLEAKRAEIDEGLAVLRKWADVLDPTPAAAPGVFDPAGDHPFTGFRIGATPTFIGVSGTPIPVEALAPLRSHDVQVRDTRPTQRAGEPPSMHTIPPTSPTPQTGLNDGPYLPGQAPRVRKPHKAKPDARTKAPAGELNDREKDALAIMRRNNSVATSKDLRKAMKRMPGWNDEQHESMVRNTMTKLRVRGLVGRTGDTWSIVGAGEEGA